MQLIKIFLNEMQPEKSLSTKRNQKKFVDKTQNEKKIVDKTQQKKFVDKTQLKNYAF